MTDGESKEINEWALDYYNLYYAVGYVDVFVLSSETLALSKSLFFKYRPKGKASLSYSTLPS